MSGVYLDMYIYLQLGMYGRVYIHIYIHTTNVVHIYIHLIYSYYELCRAQATT